MNELKEKKYLLREQQALSDIFYQNTCSIWDAQL